MLLANQPLPAGRRVGVVGNSSALAGLAATACAGAGAEVAAGYPRGRRAAAPARPSSPPRSPTTAVDDRVDALVVVFAPPLPGQLSGTDADFTAALASVALARDKPTVATFLVG